MNLENWDSVTSIIANSLAILAAIWAFLQFVGWVKRKQGNSESEADLALRAAQHAERLEELRQHIAQTEQVSAQQSDKERQMQEEIAQYEAQIRELQNTSSGQNGFDRSRRLIETMRVRNEALKRQQEMLRDRKAEEKRLHAELQAELRKEQAQYALLKSGELSPLNSSDWIRLLGWIFWMPQYINVYINLYGEDSLKKTGAWLTSTLIWLPLFLATLALSMELLPLTEKAWQPQSYAIICAVLALGWLLTGIFGHIEVNDAILWLIFVVVAGFAGFAGAGFAGAGVAVGAVGAIVGMAVGGLWGILAGIIAAVVAFFLFFGLANDVIYESIKRNQPSLIARTLLILLIIDYIFLIWYFYLGGWQRFL